MQPMEKRKTLRRTVKYPAVIDTGDGSPARACTLCDASQEGAQLLVAEPESLPSDFTLILGYDGSTRRRCKVVWRTDKRIGVEFAKNPFDARWRSSSRAATPGKGDRASEASLDIESPAKT
jgi:hypothetical protein